MNVHQMPLTELRTPEGVALVRVRDVTASTIKEMIGGTDLRFAVANIGASLMWVSREERFGFWKSEVREHIVDGDKVHLEDCPGDYFYFASEWRSDVSPEVTILLEKHH